MANSQLLGTYDFAVRMTNEIATTDQNLFFSPASMSVVMAMCYFGAKSTTKKQIGDIIFGPNSNDDRVGQIVRDLQGLTNESNEYYTLSFANRAYADKKYKVQKSYQDLLQRNFGSPLNVVDFVKDDRLGTEINRWVAAKTNNRILNLVRPGMLNAQTALFLVNALYFRGVWDDQFAEANTKPEDFFSGPQSTTKVDMMKMNKKKFYFENDRVQVLELAYGATTASMTVVLPKEKFGLRDVTKGLSGGKLREFWSGLERRDVKISLPKFKMEQDFKLNSALQKLGIVDAYSDTVANFEAMLEPSSVKIRISDVVQKSFIEVNEKGTEAAAATFVKMVPMSMPMPDPQPVTFTADHPFLLLLTAGRAENRNILFVGQYYGK